jgi:citrate synthase
MVAYGQRRRRGQELVEPDASLGFSANFLKMTFGEVPSLYSAVVAAIGASRGQRERMGSC